MPRTKVVGWATGTESDATVSVKSGRTTEQDLVMVPEPDAHPDQRPRLGADDGPNALQPRTRDSGQERDEHVHEQGEAAVPAPDAPGCPGPGLVGCAGPGHVPGARVHSRLPLVERQVPIRAHIGREEPVVPMAAAQ